MPSYRDKNDIVHDVQLTGSGSWGRCGIRFVPDEAERYGWAPEMRVSCVTCLDSDDVYNAQNGTALVVICNGCGQWWLEQEDGTLRETTQKEMRPNDSFMTMCDGTMRSCGKCRR